MDNNLIWLSLIVLISYTTQAMSGFGSTILALTLGIHLYPIDVLLPVLVPLDMIVNLYIVARHYRHISRPHLFRSILPAMGIGMTAGIIAYHHIEGNLLKKFFLSSFDSQNPPNWCDFYFMCYAGKTCLIYTTDYYV